MTGCGNMLERVRLVRVSPVLAFAEVRLPAVNLSGLRVQIDTCGELAFSAPDRRDKNGRVWPIYSLQPGAREDIEAEIARLWRRGPG